MNRSDGFDRTVSDWLHQDAEYRVPTHLDAVLRRTSTERQRPAWSSLERWLPVQSTLRLTGVPRVAWAMVLVIALVLALTAAVLFVGSRAAKPLPPPFGPAVNGTILYAAPNGDIYALDAGATVARPVVTGPTIDGAPVFTPDGRTFVFDRVQPGLDPVSSMVADADGTNIRQVGGLMLGALRSKTWSPDGLQVAAIGSIGGNAGLWTVTLDGGQHLLQAETGGLFGHFEGPAWRAGGKEVVFAAGPASGATSGLYAVAVTGGSPRALIEPSASGPVGPALSPDGTRVAYSTGAAGHGQLHVLEIETGTQRVIMFDGSVDDLQPRWSPDGQRLLFDRHSGDMYQLMIGSVDGGAAEAIGPARPAGAAGSSAGFSPDGTRVVVYDPADRSSWLYGIDDGSAIRLGVDATSPSSWQRVGG